MIRVSRNTSLPGRRASELDRRVTSIIECAGTFVKLLTAQTTIKAHGLGQLGAERCSSGWHGMSSDIPDIESRAIGLALAGTASVPKTSPKIARIGSVLRSRDQTFMHQYISYCAPQRKVPSFTLLPERCDLLFHSGGESIGAGKGMEYTGRSPQYYESRDFCACIPSSLLRCMDFSAAPSVAALLQYQYQYLYLCLHRELMPPAYRQPAL